jgi:hypothetical protein
MELTRAVPSDEHDRRLADRQRLLDEMERLELRARLLLAEHRHVVATLSDLQRQLEATVLPQGVEPPAAALPSTSPLRRA